MFGWLVCYSCRFIICTVCNLFAFSNCIKYIRMFSYFEVFLGNHGFGQCLWICNASHYSVCPRYYHKHLLNLHNLFLGLNIFWLCVWIKMDLNSHSPPISRSHLRIQLIPVLCEMKLKPQNCRKTDRRRKAGYKMKQYEWSR